MSTMSSSSCSKSSINNVSISSERVPPDGEVTDAALLAPEASAALVDPSLRCRVDPGPGIEASVSSRVAVPGPGTGQRYFSPAFTFK